MPRFGEVLTWRRQNTPKNSLAATKNTCFGNAAAELKHDAAKLLQNGPKTSPTEKKMPYFGEIVIKQCMIHRIIRPEPSSVQLHTTVLRQSHKISLLLGMEILLG